MPLALACLKVTGAKEMPSVQKSGMPEHASLLVLHKEDPRRHCHIAEFQADFHMTLPLAHLLEGSVATLQEK